MSKRTTIARQNLIISKVRRSKSTFEEIVKFLMDDSYLEAYKFKISKRTFQRDLEDIRSLYEIDIQYDFSEKVYYIKDEGQHELNVRMLEAYDTYNALNVTGRLSPFIHFEKRRPQGTENLYGLLHAIRNCYKIKFIYHKFWDEEPKNRIVEPYALKEFRNRWYIIAKDYGDQRIKTFGLDRLTELEITREIFVYPKDYNIEEEFKNCFGIIGPDKNNKPEEIVLSLTPHQGKYIKSLPLHDSQEVLIDNEDELRIKLNLYITHDLIMELLSLGQELKVLKPESLINEITDSLKNSLAQYKTKNKK